MALSYRIVEEAEKYPILHDDTLENGPDWEKMKEEAYEKIVDVIVKERKIKINGKCRKSRKINLNN